MPPAVQRQVTTPQTAPQGSVLSRIRKITEMKAGVRISLYGIPKCLGKGTPVLMYDGSIKVAEDIEPGNILMGPDSRPRTVLNTEENYGELFQISPLKGDPWVCNRDHILTLTGTSNNMGKVRDIPLSEYLVGLENEEKWPGRWRLIRSEVVLFPPPSEPLPFPPYLIGLWLGDGARRGSKICCGNQIVQEYCLSIADSIGLVCMINSEHARRQGKNGAEIQFKGKKQETYLPGREGCNPFSDYLRTRCLAGGLKTIPQEYLTASVTDRLELLAGILDTDGKTENIPCTGVTTTGEPYRNGLLFLCRSLGLAAYNYKSSIYVCANGRVSTYFPIQISGDLERVPTKRRKFPERKIDKRVNVVGFNVEQIEDGEFYGFELDGDGRFLLGDFTVTHNSGKTRLACTFPKPLLLIGAEDGTASVVGMEGVDFILLERCEDLRDIAGLLKSGQYKTAVLDSGTSLRDMRIKEILRLSEMPIQKGFGFASREAWGECSMSIKQLLRPIFDLARAGTIENLVIIAQEQAYSGSEEGTASDLIKPTVSSALGKSLADWINQECDCIGQTFTRLQVVTKTHQPIKDGPTVTMTEKTGNIDYCLRVGTDGVYQAGIRVREGLVLQQSILTNPSYDRLLRVIKGEKVD